MSFTQPGISLAAGSSVSPAPVSTDLVQTLNGMPRPRKLGNEAIAPQLWLPGDIGYNGWTFDPALATATVGVTAGQISFAACKWPGGFITQVAYQVTSAGVTLTANQNFVGLYYLPGSVLQQQGQNNGQFNLANAILVGITADQSAAWTTTGAKANVFTFPVAGQPSGQNLANQSFDAGVFAVAFLANGTTVPGFAGNNSVAPFNGRVGAALIANRSGKSTVTGITTALPSDLTGGINNVTAPIWAGLF